MENIWPKRVGVTQEQASRLRDLAKAFVPNFVGEYDGDWISFSRDKEQYAIQIHWFEFCFTVLASQLAEYYASCHIDCTKSWARRMILQKLAHEVFITNPIDTLYSIWTEPQLYKQGL